MKKVWLLIIIITLNVSILTGCSFFPFSNKAPAPGFWENDIFTSDFANLNLTLPEGFIIWSDEELSEMLKAGIADINKYGGYLSEEELKYTTIYDMAVSNPNGSAIFLIFERLANGV